MTSRTSATERKRSERRRRAAKGEVALSGWLSAEDHAALTQMAREAGMTQAQVIARLIGIRAAVLGLERFSPDGNCNRAYMVDDDDGNWVHRSDVLRATGHSDLTAAVGLVSERVKEGGK